jgi:hypothetical protein
VRILAFLGALISASAFAPGWVNPGQTEAGYAGETAIPTRAVEDLLTARIYSGGSGPPDPSGVRAALDALQLAGTAAQVTELARRNALRLTRVDSKSKAWQDLANSPFFRFTVGGIVYRDQAYVGKLSPETVPFLETNASAAMALLGQANSTMPQTEDAARRYLQTYSCEVYSLGDSDDGARRAEAAYKLIQSGWPVREAIWENQPRYADFAAGNEMVIPFGYMYDTAALNAVTHLRPGQASRPFTMQHACIAVFLGTELNDASFNRNDTNPKEAMISTYIHTKAARDLEPEIAAIPLQWTSATAKLAQTWNRQGHMGYQTRTEATDPDQLEKDKAAQGRFEEAFEGIRNRDLPQIAERLCVSACESLYDPKLREDDLRRLLASDENPDLRARLAKVLSQEGAIKQAAHEAAIALRGPMPNYGVFYRPPLGDVDLREIVQTTGVEGAEPEDRAMIEAKLKADAPRQRPIDPLKPPRVPTAREVEARRKSLAYSQEFQRRFQSDRDREKSDELAYFVGKVAFLERRCGELAAESKQPIDSDKLEALQIKLKEMDGKLQSARVELATRLRVPK